MDCIEVMKSEHRDIEKVLDSLEHFARAVARGGAVDSARLAGHVAFLRTYADAIHHGKEEAILFAALKRQGCPDEFGPVIAGICRDHEMGRNLVDDLEVAARRPQPWTDAQREALWRTTGSFVTMLRRHILAEDELVFPRTWELLSPESRALVEEACGRFEAAHATQREAMAELLRELTSVD